MKPRRLKKGKAFEQEKRKLLVLANAITSGKELDIRQKIDRSKGSASFIDAPLRQSAGNRRRLGLTQASEKLRAAKDLLVARKTRQKRDKARARKDKQHVSKTGSNGNLVEHAYASPSRKRVSFAD